MPGRSRRLTTGPPHRGIYASIGKSGVRSSVPIYDTLSRRVVFLEELAEVWRYRDLIVQLVGRDIKVRYKRSVLGVAWTMLNPLGMMLILTFVFSYMFRFELPRYPVYVLSGLILWNFFAQSTTSAVTQLIWGAPLISRIFVPRTAFAISAVVTGLVNTLISLLPMGFIMVLEGVPITPWQTAIIIPVALLAIFSLGVGLFISTFAVAFPDVVDMYQIVLLAWYFLTPVFYPESALPYGIRSLLKFNPMYHFIGAFRAPIYFGLPPEPQSLAAGFAASISTLVVGWLVYTAQADKIPLRA